MASYSPHMRTSSHHDRHAPPSRLIPVHATSCPDDVYVQSLRRGGLVDWWLEFGGVSQGGRVLFDWGVSGSRSAVLLWVLTRFFRVEELSRVRAQIRKTSFLRSTKKSIACHALV
eukprot:363066-Chlamydomonas_euryale.AAC.1